MNPLKIPRVKAGDPIRADHWNRLAEAAEASQLVLGAGANLEGGPGPGGAHLRAVLPKVIWARLDEPFLFGGGYGWKEQIPDPGSPGGWKDGNLSDGGTNVNAAYNTVNGATIDTETNPPIVRLSLASDNTWRFTFGECS